MLDDRATIFGSYPGEDDEDLSPASYESPLERRRTTADEEEEQGLPHSTVRSAPIHPDSLEGDENKTRYLGKPGLLQGKVGEKVAAIRKRMAKTIDLRRELRETKKSATIDGLTGILNKKTFLSKFHALLQRRFSEEKRREEDLDESPTGLMEGPTLIMFDIDHFKRINDVHGHDGGDAILKEVVKRATKALRADDIFARWGGEEFAVIVDSGGPIVAERLRQAINSEPVIYTDPRSGETSSVKVTISVGVAAIPSIPMASSIEQTAKIITINADEALYAAKKGEVTKSIRFTDTGPLIHNDSEKSSRNQVCLSVSLGGAPVVPVKLDSSIKERTPSTRPPAPTLRSMRPPEA